MPIYEYKCSRCEQTFEVMQSFSEAPLGTHPGCGGNVARVFSAPGIIFKGSGFHVTDYRKDSSSSGVDKVETKPAEKTESKSTEKKSEKKPDTKKAEK